MKKQHGLHNRLRSKSDSIENPFQETTDGRNVSSPKLMMNTTDEQQLKLSDKFKFVASIPVRTAYALEQHLSAHEDYKQEKLLYIPHSVVKEDQPKFNGCPFVFFIFITDDKYVRKRAEKFFKTKLQWSVYEFNEDDTKYVDDMEDYADETYRNYDHLDSQQPVEREFSK